jgi:hypothetical protein
VKGAKWSRSGEPPAEPLDPLADLVRDLAQGGEIGRAEMERQLREQGLEVNPAPVLSETLVHARLAAPAGAIPRVVILTVTTAG